jgi:sRNA-binding carbon storage regulator CsrA
MLILSRHTGQRCRMTVPGEWMKNGEPLVLEVMLASIRGANKARLGFDAPRDVEVVRIDDPPSLVPTVSVSP